MKHSAPLSVVFLLASAVADNAGALTLFEAYEAALQNDPFFQTAVFARQAGEEEKNLGRSQILPEIALSARASSNKTDRETTLATGPFNEKINYQSSVAGVYLRQPLINLEKYANYRQGGIRSELAGKQYLSSRQEMILRIVTAYIDAVAARQERELIKVEKHAIAEQHEQAKRFFARGEGTVTDIDEAKARLDLVAIQEMEADDRYSVSLSILSQLTGRDPGNLPEFVEKPMDPSAKPLFEKDLESLIQLALDNNFDLAGKKLAVEAAKQELNKARAGFLPSVDIVASVSRNDQESITTLNQEYTNRTVGVELMWPLAKGGYYASLMRQNEAKLQQARQDEESSKVRVRVDVNRQYRGAENGHAKAEALSNAIRSSEKAVASVSMGFKAGTRTSVDILNAKKEWIKVRKDYVDSMRDFIIAKLKLEAAAGALDESHLRWADNFFMPQK